MARNLSIAQLLCVARYLDGRREVRFDDVERAVSAQTVDPLPSARALSLTLRDLGWREDRVHYTHGEAKVFYVPGDHG